MQAETNRNDIRPLRAMSGDELAAEILRLLSGDTAHRAVEPDDPYGPGRYVAEVWHGGEPAWKSAALAVFEQLYYHDHGVEIKLSEVKSTALKLQKQPDKREVQEQFTSLLYFLKQYYYLMSNVPSDKVATRTFDQILGMETFVEQEIKEESRVLPALDALLERMRGCVSSGHPEGVRLLEATLGQYYESPRRAAIALSFFSKPGVVQLESALIRSLHVFVRSSENEKVNVLDTLSTSIRVLAVNETDSGLIGKLANIVSQITDPFHRAEAASLIARAINRDYEWRQKPLVTHDFLQKFYNTFFSTEVSELQETSKLLAKRLPVVAKTLLSSLRGKTLPIGVIEYTETAVLAFWGLYIKAVKPSVKVELKEPLGWSALSRFLKDNKDGITVSNDRVIHSQPKEWAAKVKRSSPVFEFSSYVMFVSRNRLLKCLERQSQDHIIGKLESILEERFKFDSSWKSLPQETKELTKEAVRALLEGAKCSVLKKSDLDLATRELIFQMSGVHYQQVESVLTFCEAKSSNENLEAFLQGKSDLFLGGANHAYYLNRYHSGWAVALNTPEFYKAVKVVPVDYLVFNKNSRLAKCEEEVCQLWFDAFSILKTMLLKDTLGKEERRILAYLLCWTNQFTKGFCDMNGLHTILLNWNHFYGDRREAVERGEPASKKYASMFQKNY